MIAVAGGLATVVTAFSANLVVPAVLKPWLRRRFLQRVARSGSVCLTFDDGPSPRVTPRILDLLHDAAVPATFCVMGANADRHPELVRRLLDEGHQLVVHGHEHVHPWRTWPGHCLVDLLRGESVVAGYAGPHGVRFVRPPYGKLDLPSLVHMLAQRRQLVYWSIDPRDYAAATAEEIVAGVLPRLVPGAVVLLHDGVTPAGRNEDVLPRAVERLLSEIVDRGLRTATVAGALARSDGGGAR